MAAIKRRRARSAPGATLGRAALAGLFAVAPRVVYSVEVNGFEQDPRAAPNYYAIQHKRDLDPMAPLPALIVHRGWRALAGDLRFAMRADAFTPGFLSRIVMRPRWLAALVRPLSVGALLRWLAVYPLESPRLRPAELWIRDAVALAEELPAGQVVAPWQLQALAQATGQQFERLAVQPVSTLLSWRYQAALQGFCGADVLNEPWRHTIRRRVVADVYDELATLSAWLREGGALFGAPEGQLSPDGRLSPISAGFHRLVRHGPDRLTVVPIVISYDFMTVRRPCMFVDVGQPIETGAAGSPTELDASLRLAWLRAGRFTTTQLASGFLVEQSRSAAPSFTLGDLATALADRAARLHASGRHVDTRLLRLGRPERLARAYLGYARRRGLMQPDGAGRYVPSLGDLSISVAPREVGYHQQPLAYAYNELGELLSLDAPGSDTSGISGVHSLPLRRPSPPHALPYPSASR
jgi:hypothetical protein